MSTNQWQLPRNFDITKEPDIECKGCGKTIFETVVTLKNVPAFASPTGQDAVVPIPIFKCCNCGILYSDFMKNGS